MTNRASAMAETKSLKTLLLFACFWVAAIHHQQADAFAFAPSTLALVGNGASVMHRPPVLAFSSPRHVRLNAQKGGEGRGPDENKRNNDGEDDDETPQEPTLSTKWKTRTNLSIFLTQCSIQSFLFLLKTMREPQTVLWLKNFTQAAIQDETEQPAVSAATQEGGVSNDVAIPVGESEKVRLLQYHGLNWWNTTAFSSSEAYFVKLMESPVEQYTVESSMSYVPDYDLEISPPRISLRLLSVREQLAREFANDLQVLSKMGVDCHLQSTEKEDHREEAPVADPDDLDGREIKIEDHNLMFLDLDCGGLSPSLLRKGNFDLLMLLTTQEAIHRLLNDPERQKSALASSNMYLEEFYSNRLLSHFDGDQTYGRADQFLQELLQSPPAVRGQAMVDPVGVAREIIAMRKRVAAEWSVMSRLLPEEEHVVIRRMQLEQLMSGTASGGQSFEEALKGGSSSEMDTSASVPFFVPPLPSPVVEEMITGSEDEAEEEEAVVDNRHDHHQELELVGSGGGGSSFGFLNMTESVFE